MSDKHYIGLDVTSFKNTGKHKPVSRVTLFLDRENYYTAGDDTGKEITANCPSATQAMADALLAKFKGYEHQSFNANAANIDPAAELGDGVTVGGIYATLSRLKDDGNGYAGAGAADEPELEEEYPYVSPIQQEIKRQSTEIYSLISKTAEEIRLEVVKKIDEEEANTLISAAIGKIELSVSSKDGSTSFVLTDGEAEISAQTLNLTVDAVNVTGKLTASQIDATELKVSAANVTGSLTIGQLPSDVAVQDDIPQYISDLYDDSDFVNETGVVEIIDGTVTADYVNALGVSAQYLKGKYVYLMDSNEEIAGQITIDDATTADNAIYLTSYGALRMEAEYGDVYIINGAGHYLHFQAGSDALTVGYADLRPNGNATLSCGTSSFPWSDVYAANATIQTSDREKKTDIVYGLDYLDALFDGLRPGSFLFKDGASGRRHPGLIAQDVEELLSALGIDALDFSPFIKSPRKDEYGRIIENEYEYALRYGELIPLCIDQIQKLKQRVHDLEVTS